MSLIPKTSIYDQDFHFETLGIWLVSVVGTLMFAEGLLRYSCLWFHLIFISMGSSSARCDPFWTHLVASGKTLGGKKCVPAGWCNAASISVTLPCHSLFIYFSHRLNFFHFSLCLHFRERPFGTVRGGKYSSCFCKRCVCVFMHSDTFQQDGARGAEIPSGVSSQHSGSWWWRCCTVCREWAVSVGPHTATVA